MNVVVTGSGPVRRGAGHRGADAVRPPRARRAARPRARRHLRALPDAGRGPAAPRRRGLAVTPGGRAGARLVLATHNAAQGRRAARDPAARLPGLDPDGVVSARDLGASRPVEDGVTFDENALLKARALAARHRAPGRRRRLGAVRRRARRCARRSSPRGGPGVTATTRRTCACCSPSSLTCRRRTARRASRCAAALVTPEGSEHVETGALPGRLTTAPRGTGGFGYDPVLEPDAQPAPCRAPPADLRRADPGGEERDLPPRSGVPGAGARRRRHLPG